MKKLVIFDLDGTLINTIADLAGATNYALKACGYPLHDTDAYRFFVGNGINKLFERALPESERNEENIRKIRSLFIPYYNMHNADLSRPYPGITHVLESLQAEGVSLAVASNKYQEATEKLIKHYFPQIGFIRIFGQRPEETAYIGDSGVDMQTGINAKVETIGAAWGFRPRTELEAYHPAFIADTPETLLDYLMK